MNIRAIVLAAGHGTRMKSATPKVLHEICGRPMLWYTLQALHEAGISDILVVTSDGLDERVREFGVTCVIQHEQLGTGHAVRIALDALDLDAAGRILVAYGDMPLVPARIFADVAASLGASGAPAPMSLVTVKMHLPSNFGRIVRNRDGVERIVEMRDASPEELAIDEMNAGIYAFDEAGVRTAVAALRNDNAQREYYLTDVVAHFVGRGEVVQAVPAADRRDLLGINDRVELALARKTMNARIAAQHMRDGVTIIDPDTTYLEPELTIGRDTVLYPNTAISRLSEIGERCTIGPNTRLSYARLGDDVVVRESVVVESELRDGVTVGPFAHVRGGSILGDGVKIGNFVEVKNSTLAEGAKASHLSYLGDATVGEATNIGAGTITCNFDGIAKHRTTIGKRVAIGSNTSLIAPVTIGDDALTGAGSVVTKDVPARARVVGNPARRL